MSIYAKKNSRGQLTGKYLVEVNVGSRRHRGTADTLIEARQLEESLSGIRSPISIAMPRHSHVVNNPNVYTIGDLRREAVTIWAGNKDEARSLQLFNTCCDILGDPTDIRSVRTRQLDALLVALKARGLGDATCHRYLATISAGLRWAHKRDLIDGMPHVPWPEDSKGRDTIITEEEQARLIAWLERTGEDSVALVYRVLFQTGMRIGELLSLRMENVDTNSGCVNLIDTKNGDDRQVPLEPSLCMELRMALSEGLANYQSIWKVSKRAEKVLGINHSITPHVVRHTVVTRLEAAGVGLRTIGALVGHRSIKTTARYAHPSRETLRAATEKLT